MKNYIYKNLFSNIYNVHIKKFIGTLDNIKSIINLFESDSFVFSVLGSDFNSDFYKCIDNSQLYTILLPKNNTIVSEIFISIETEVFEPFLKELFTMEPRCITVFGFNSRCRLCKEELKFIRDSNIYHLLKSEIINYAASFVLEESCAIIDVSSDTIQPSELHYKINEL